MKKLISVLLSIVLITTLCLPISTTYGAPVTVAGVEDQVYDGHSYQVYLPVGYDQASAVKYPSVYLMPQDGLSSSSYLTDGITTRLGELMSGNQVLDMIIIMPSYEATDDFTGLLPSLVADVESKYNVIKDANYRGILGVGVGGYMAYAAALLDSTSAALFKAVGSHIGNFTDNIWTSKGSVYTAIASLSRATMISKYYYIDAANGDSLTTASGSAIVVSGSAITISGASIDIGSTLMKKTNPYYGTQWQAYATPDTTYAEYSVRDGIGNAAFYLEALGRSLNRFSKIFAKNLITGTVTLSPQAVTASKNTIDAVITLTLTDVLQQYTSVIPAVEVTVSMIDPNSGAILASQQVAYTDMIIGTPKMNTIILNRSDMAPGINTTVVVEAKVQGMSFEISRQSLIRVQQTGTADDEQLVDLMGDWYFNAYKNYSANDTTVVDLDQIANIVPSTYTQWDVVQPAIGWWTSTFSASLNGSSNRACYAWYVRTFDLSASFPKEDLLLTIGKFDEANEVYLNGTLVGNTGYKYTGTVGVYDGSNPWDVNCVYNFDTSLLNYGGSNTIAIRMCNSSGGGGWYEGPVGLYSKAAYNKASGKPSVYVENSVAEKVTALVAQQNSAIETENITGYAATLSPEFFHSGYNKERKLSEIQKWVDTYSNINIEDTSVGVFVKDNSYNYQAHRIITGVDSEGTAVTIFEGDASEYYIAEGTGITQYGDHSRFYVDTYETDAITGTTQTLTARVYLPEGYFDNQELYPTAYLFHGINSSSNTFVIDKVDQILDDSMSQGTIDKMIVIIPDDPTKTSFWKDAYANMITEDLIPTVDARYRTIQDARYRFTAGCSMGGAGSFGIGLFNPNLFSGAISFYGALSYNDIVSKTEGLSASYLSRYGLYITSGNMDNYSFYDVAGQMSRILTLKGVAHNFSIDNGKHDSIYYLPLFEDAFAYISNRMTDVVTDDSLVQGSMSYTKTNGALSIQYNLSASSAIGNYLETVPTSAYTVNENPSIVIPMTILVEQDNQVVASTTKYFNTMTQNTWTDTITLGNADLDTTKAFTIKQYASVLTDTKLVSTYQIEKETVVISSPSSPAQTTVTPTPTKVPTVDADGALAVEVKLTKEDINTEGKEVRIPMSADLMKQFTNNEVSSIHLNLQMEAATEALFRNSLVLGAELLEAAKKADKSVTVTVRGEDNRESYTWTFDGDALSETSQNMADVNLSLNVKKMEDISGLAEMLGTDTSTKAMVIEFNHEGVLPAQASVRIYVGDQEGMTPGDKIFLYHYNQESGKLETLPNSSNYVVDAEGYITIFIIHCSDYVASTVKASADQITSLKNQIAVTPSKKTLYIGGSGKTTTIKTKLPSTLELVNSLSDKASMGAVGEVTLQYSSSNKKIAKVDKKGKITAVGTGKAVITTKVLLYSGKTKTVKTTITVKKH
ncbi:MAG: alpha/beta hydrolase-fold protein [Mobilitalea sp.]